VVSKGGGNMNQRDVTILIRDLTSGGTWGGASMRRLFL